MRALLAFTLVLSACTGSTDAPRASSLDEAAQSVAQIGTVIKRHDVQNCQGDSPTGTSVYLTYALPPDGNVPNEHWEHNFRANGWKPDDDTTAFHRSFSDDEVIAVVNQTPTESTYAIVLYLERGELACPR